MSRTLLIAVALVGLAILQGTALGERVTKTYDPTTFGFTKGDDDAMFTAYVERDANGKPTVVGVSFPDFVSGRLGLPADSVYPTFDLPSVPNVPYKVFEMDWNAQGHPGGLSLADRAIYNTLPEGEERDNFAVEHGAWMVPHFDFHFYHVDMDYINAIQPCLSFPPCVPDPSMVSKTLNYPPARFFPPSYEVDPSAIVPMMGNHWDDVTEDVTPEHFAANPTVTYGSWDGRMHFTEIGPAKTTFEAIRASDSKTFVASLRRPSHFQRTGYYAGQYRITYIEETQNFYFELFDFEHFYVDDAYARDEWEEKLADWQTEFEAWKQGQCS